MENQIPPSPPHVLIFPLPLQGPIKCMLKFAELLCLSGGIDVTFLNTQHNHRRLLRYTAVESRFSAYPQFRFQTVSDGLPDDHPRSIDRLGDLLEGLWTVTQPNFKEMLSSGGGDRRPVTCVIADGALTFALDVAEEVGIPLIYFETISPCGLWTYFCVHKLIDAGEIPFQGDDLNAPIRSVPGMEGFLRHRDLPSFCRTTDLNDPVIQLAMRECRQVPRSRGLILNTFEELDGPVLSHLRSLCPNLYPVGPLHTHLKRTRLEMESTPSCASSEDSLWQEDNSCITWLDKQPSRSVIYISIGSLAIMTMEQLVEFWHGLVNSGVRFLWVRRPNSIVGEDSVGQTEELLKATKERGCLVSWTSQEEVLAHQAIGGFLTHSGWNSTLESLMEGVPMVCWPYFVDQHVNSRFVSEVWKIGIDIKDTCDRGVIEKMIKDLMEVKGDEFRQSMDRLSILGRESVSVGGSSACNLDRLFEDIRSMKV